MTKHTSRFLYSMVIGVLLSAAQCVSNKSIKQQKQELAQRLTPELMAKYVKYEEAMVPYAWHRHALATHHKLPLEHQEAFAKGLTAAGEISKLDLKEAELLHLLVGDYVVHKGAVSHSARFLAKADERLRRADGGARATWADIKKETEVGLEEHRQQAMAFEAEYGEAVVKVIAPYVVALDNLYGRIIEQPIPEGLNPFD